MIPPWMIEELEEERRRREKEQDPLRLPLEEARDTEEAPVREDDARGVTILDISPVSPNTIQM